MKKALLLILTIMFAGTLTAQNELDENGERTGPWKGYYPDGTLRYEAFFEHGKPVGTLTRYDESGNIAAVMHYYTGTDRCFTEMYGSSGNVRARGVYDNRMKDSLWQYLAKDGKIRLTENYQLNQLNGLSEAFYPSGIRSRLTSYKDGKMHGQWIQYFENGDTMVIANYNMGALDGLYQAYYPGGELQVEGMYINDLKDGDWTYYKEDGALSKVLKYINGDIQNPEVLEETYENFIKNIEKNVGNMPDPASEGWQ